MIKQLENLAVKSDSIDIDHNTITFKVDGQEIVITRTFDIGFHPCVNTRFNGWEYDRTVITEKNREKFASLWEYCKNRYHIQRSDYVDLIRKDSVKFFKSLK